MSPGERSSSSNSRWPTDRRVSPEASERSRSGRSRAGRRTDGGPPVRGRMRRTGRLERTGWKERRRSTTTERRLRQPLRGRRPRPPAPTRAGSPRRKRLHPPPSGRTPSPQRRRRQPVRGALPRCPARPSHQGPAWLSPPRGTACQCKSLVGVSCLDTQGAEGPSRRVRERRSAGTPRFLLGRTNERIHGAGYACEVR